MSYTCITCNYTCETKQNLNKHFKTKKHISKKWEKNNADVDVLLYIRKHSRRMAYILTDIHDLYAKPIGSYTK